MPYSKFEYKGIKPYRSTRLVYGDIITVGGVEYVVDECKQMASNTEKVYVIYAFRLGGNPANIALFTSAHVTHVRKAHASKQLRKEIELEVLEDKIKRIEFMAQNTSGEVRSKYAMQLGSLRGAYTTKKKSIKEAL